MNLEKMSDLILASTSPRRIEMLRNVGIKFRVIPSNVKEDIVRGLEPKEYVSECARLKAMEIANKFPDSWVLAADTIVVIDTEILGKPRDDMEAIRMLWKLSGKTHKVISAFCLVRKADGKRIIESVETEVKFKDLTEGEVTGYVATGEPLDKAGAYGIQGVGSFLVKEIKGSYTNVVGMPLTEVIDCMLELKVARPFEVLNTCSRLETKDKRVEARD